MLYLLWGVCYNITCFLLEDSIMTNKTPRLASIGANTYAIVSIALLSSLLTMFFTGKINITFSPKSQPSDNIVVLSTDEFNSLAKNAKSFIILKEKLNSVNKTKEQKI
jgi:hypothetical protein